MLNTFGPDFDSLKRNVVSAEVRRMARQLLAKTTDAEVIWCSVEALADGTYRVIGEIVTSSYLQTVTMNSDGRLV